MNALEVAAKPEFGKPELEWLTRVRATYAHSLGPPAFTLVFPGHRSTMDAVVKHVEAVCAVTPRIRFCLRSALIVPEHGGFNVFLVPDEGFGAIVRLHDRLHVGPLADRLRPDVPYIPHLTVANTPDLAVARREKALLNSHDLVIGGRINRIEVLERDGAGRRCVATLPLARNHLFR